MARRNRVNQGPLVIVMLVILAAWLFRQSGADSLLTPAGMLLLLALLLVLNSILRKKKRPPQTTNRPKDYPSYGYAPRRAAWDRSMRHQRVFSRTSRAAKPETWPYDGSYCVHCGLKKRGEDSICRRCRQPIDYPA